MGFAACGPRRKSDKRWQAVLREQVPYANTVRLEKYVSSIFEELNWAYSSAFLISCLWPAAPSCCQSVLGSVTAGVLRQWQQVAPAHLCQMREGFPPSLHELHPLE